MDNSENKFFETGITDASWNVCEVGFGNISISEIKYYLLNVAFPL